MSIHELLPWYMNETLAPEEATAFEEHLSGCDACGKELDLLHDVQARLETDGEALLSDHPTPEHLIAALAADADDADLDPGVARSVRRHVALCTSCADEAGWAMRESAGAAAAPLSPAPDAPPHRGLPTWVWALAASVLLAAVAVPIALQMGAGVDPAGPTKFDVVEPTERAGGEPTPVQVSDDSDRIYVVFPLDVGPGAFPLHLEITDSEGQVVHADDSIRSEDLSQQGLFLMRVLPRRQMPDGRYLARITTAGGDDVTEYPFQVIAASHE